MGSHGIGWDRTALRGMARATAAVNDSGACSCALLLTTHSSWWKQIRVVARLTHVGLAAVCLCRRLVPKTGEAVPRRIAELAEGAVHREVCRAVGQRTMVLPPSRSEPSFSGSLRVKVASAMQTSSPR